MSDPNPTAFKAEETSDSIAVRNVMMGEARRFPDDDDDDYDDRNAVSFVRLPFFVPRPRFFCRPQTAIMFSTKPAPFPLLPPSLPAFLLRLPPLFRRPSRRFPPPPIHRRCRSGRSRPSSECLPACDRLFARPDTARGANEEWSSGVE